MSRLESFSKAVPIPIFVRDSRFGLRKLVSNPEKPRIGEYTSPGRGPNGEHQS